MALLDSCPGYGLYDMKWPGSNRLLAAAVLTGPVRGPRLNKAMAVGLVSGRVTSAIVPPPNAIGVPPTHPDINLKTINWAMFWLSALPMIKARKTRFVAWYTGSRPYVSLRGEMTMGPIARPRT